MSRQPPGPQQGDGPPDQETPPRPDLTEAEERRPGPTWKAIESIPVFLIAAITTTLVSASLARVRHFCGGKAVIEALLGELALGVTVVLWIRYVNRGSVAALGLPRRPLREILLGIGVGVALIFAGAATLYIVREAVSLLTGKTPKQPEQVMACVRGSALALLGPVVVLVAPVGEEAFFRGFLYQGLRRRMPVWGAATLSAAVFGLVHVYPLLIPALFVVGLGLALLYERQRSLLAPIVAHATFNLLGFLTIALSRR
jgi:CAAX protease family protein